MTQRRLTRQLQAERHQREAAAKSQDAAGIKPSWATGPGPAAAPRKKKGQRPSEDVAPDSTTARVLPAPKKPAR